jgi:hypothetical protein
MKLGPIVLKLRAANTRFNNFIGGAAELETALSNTLRKEMAFVIPLNDATSGGNTQGNTVFQYITERFAIIAAISNDSSAKDKTGLTAYDNVNDIRAEFLSAIYGWKPTGAYDPIIYMGGKLLGLDRAYLWYQFEFEYKEEISNGYCFETNTNTDGVAPDGNPLDRQAFPDFDTLYVNYKLAPSADLPYEGSLPLDDGFPDVSIPDNAQWIDFKENPDDGSFFKSFASAFKIDKN